VGAHVGERAPVAGERKPSVEGVHALERLEELPDRVGRETEIEVERDAAQEMVAGQQEAAVCLVQADVGGSVTRGLVHRPWAEV